jgi:hypothetical protein
MKAIDDTDASYRALARLDPDGPAYSVRFRGDRAVFSRQREDGVIEVIILPEDAAIYLAFSADSCSRAGDSSCPAETQ